MFCAHCGKPLPTGASFCPACGARTSLTERSDNERDERSDRAPTSLVESRRSLVVDRYGSGDFRSLREAMVELPVNGRIVLRPGVYRENLRIDLPIEIVGDGPASDIVILGEEACVEMRTDRALLRGISLRLPAIHSEHSRSNCVDIRYGHLVLEDCDIMCSGSSCLSVSGPNSLVTARRSSLHGGCMIGAQFENGARGALTDCSVFETVIAGVLASSGAGPFLQRTLIHGATGSGLIVSAGASVTLEESSVYANGAAGIVVRDGGVAVVRRSQARDNRHDGVMSHGGSHVEIQDSDVFRNARHGISASDGSFVVVSESRINLNGGSGISGETYFSKIPTRLSVEGCDLRGNTSGSFQVQPGCRVTRKMNKETPNFPGWQALEDGLRQAFEGIAQQIEAVLPRHDVAGGSRRQSPQRTEKGLHGRLEDRLERCNDLIAAIEGTLALELLPPGSPAREAYRVALELRDRAQRILGSDPMAAELTVAYQEALQALEGLKLVQRTLHDLDGTS